MKAARRSGQDKNYDEVHERRAKQVRSLYPEYIYEANAYEFLAEADLAKGTRRPPADPHRIRKNGRAQSGALKNSPRSKKI
jgi:hypothetical protein